MNYHECDIYGMYKNQRPIPGPGLELMGAVTLIGNDVYNRREERLGEIKDIVIDMRRGQTAFAVLSFGGFLHMGNKFFIVPWNALWLDTLNQRFVLDVDKENLENAPGFDKDNWPNMSDPNWRNELFLYYGTKPYDQNEKFM